MTFFKKNLIILIIAIAALLRIININTEPFWGDEILSLDIVKHYQQGTAGMVHYLREVEIHPPLYYVLLQFWTSQIGFSEGAVRSLSLVFGLLLVALVYYIGKKWHSQNFGLYAAFITAILPMQIEFSQEARPYIFFCFFGLINIFSLWEYLKDRRKKHLLLYLLSSIFGIYLHYSFGFILVSTLTWWFIELFRERDKRGFMEWAVSLLIIFLSFYFWLEAFFYKILLSNLQISGIERSSIPARPINFFEATINNIIWTVKEKDLLPLEIFTIGLFKIMFAYFVFRLIYKKKDDVKEFFIKYKKLLVYLLWIAVSSLILFLFSPFSISYAPIIDKHLIFLSVTFSFLFAFLLISLNNKESVLILILFILSIFTINIRILGNDEKSDFQFAVKSIGQHINNNYIEDDLVLVYWGSTRSNLNHYLKNSISATSFYPLIDLSKDYLASRETLGFWENEAQFRIVKPSIEDEEKQLKFILNKEKPKRVWLVYFYGNSNVYGWFEKNNWRHSFNSLGNMFPVDLYVKKENVIQK